MRALSSFTELSRKRQTGRVIPLLDTTMSRDLFSDVGRQLATLRLSDLDRTELGVRWTGGIGKWGTITQGLERVQALDVAVNNRRLLRPLVGGVPATGRRLTDWLRVGLNRAGTYDPSCWSAKLYLQFRGGGSGDEIWWARLVLEEPTEITEESVTLRFSGPELFLTHQDGSNLNPSTIISVQNVGSAGVGVGVTTMGFPITVAGGFTYLLVAVGWDNPTMASLATARMDGAAMTHVASQTSSPIATFHVEFWEYVGPATGSRTVEFTFTEPVPAAHKVCGGLALANVHQTTPRVLPVASASGSTVDVLCLPSSDRGHLVVDAAGFYFESGLLPSLTVGSGQTQRINRTDAGNPGGGSDFIRLGLSTQLGDVASVPMEWTLGSARNWAALGVSLIPAA